MLAWSDIQEQTDIEITLIFFAMRKATWHILKLVWQLLKLV